MVCKAGLLTSVFRLMTVAGSPPARALPQRHIAKQSDCSLAFCFDRAQMPMASSTGASLLHGCWVVRDHIQSACTARPEKGRQRRGSS